MPPGQVPGHRSRGHGTPGTGTRSRDRSQAPVAACRHAGPAGVSSNDLWLIDGYAQFFRAFHAIRTDMRSPVTSEPTNMTYGFVDMLLKLQNVHHPKRLAVVLDVSGDRGTFRNQIYPEYKANRDAPPSELKPQVERCLSLLGQLGIPVYGSEGFEADDVIATIV
ncbi:MAG: hypothetical protein CMJ67_03815, partial [Planctomycetaceae bacterium]|nr:hypothetical protein [Planctomycetaceae bacterium]